MAGPRSSAVRAAAPEAPGACRLHAVPSAAWRCRRLQTAWGWRPPRSLSPPPRSPPLPVVSAGAACLSPTLPGDLLYEIFKHLRNGTLKAPGGLAWVSCWRCAHCGPCLHAFRLAHYYSPTPCAPAARCRERPGAVCSAWRHNVLAQPCSAQLRLCTLHSCGVGFQGAAQLLQSTTEHHRAPAALARRRVESLCVQGCTLALRHRPGELLPGMQALALQVRPRLKT